MRKTTIPMTPEAAKAVSKLDADGVWVVGGAVRDALAGDSHDRFDIDLAVGGAEAWTRRASEALGARASRISTHFNVWRIPLSDGQIDVWDLPDGDIERDLRRRDFTANAMAVPLCEFRCGRIAGSLIDPHGGRSDVASRTLRLVTHGALRDDPLRMLRAVRLEAEGGWRPDAELRAAIRRDDALIDRAAAERRWDELRRLFESDRLPWALRRLEQSGLLDRLFPELALGRGVDQRPVHRRDVFRHQLDSVRWIVRLTACDSPRSLRASAIRRELEPLLSTPGIRSALDAWRVPLRLATLLHDIGKPGTRTVDADGSTHFYGHSELGAQMARSRLVELRLPSGTISQVELLIEQHLRPGQVNAPGQMPTDRALHRFHASLGEAVAPLCWLFLADSLATAGADALLPRWPAYAARVARIVSWQPRVRTKTGVMLDGHAIMDVTGLAPGPLVGEIRAKIDEAVAIGEIGAVDEAREMAIRLAREARETRASTTA
ncbi:MAG: HD domain-containing protein [Chloroflexi bacterium]|nr:HD domain-containing protein [Chloroflexota bacterium]MYF21673.1 HD domain-containing protein [Chloroflexota bacterium]